MPPKILVIDDDPETRRLIKMIMMKEGYELAMANSGEVGLEMARQDKPDLLILDIMMPDMDGYEVCRRFRNTPALSQIPIIMFTAKSQPQDRETGYLVGADDYLVKPTMPAKLLERVEAHLARTVASIDTPEVSAAAPVLPRQKTSPEESGGFIGVLGSRGGAGATITAMNLAASLAEAGHQTILADFDLTQGHIARYLNQRPSGFLSSPSAVDTISLEEELVTYRPNLDLLCAPAGIDDWSASKVGWLSRVADRLQRSGRIVVVDLGRGISPIGRLVLANVDQLLVCIRPERLSLLAVPDIVPVAKELLQPGASVHILMLAYEGNQALPREAIEKTLGHPLLDIILVRPQLLAKSANRGRLLVDAAPDEMASQQFRKLARQLATVWVSIKD